MTFRKKILVAPLNWGLGHATRCIPIINYLLEREINLVIAAEGRSSELLKGEFPNLEHISLGDYNIKYPKDGNMPLAMAKQFFKISYAIKREHKNLSRYIRSSKFDGIISDNRYGCYHDKTPSVIISHQINLLMPKGWKWIENRIQKEQLIRFQKFNEIWIPDAKGNPNLSGALGHSFMFKGTVRYLGSLSRFKFEEKELENDLAIILSGPEPQRTMLEEKLLKQIKQLDKTCKVIRGVTESSNKVQLTDKIELTDHLNSKQLEELILKSKHVVCRPGYSSIMDLVRLKKCALFIPTPGQTEQEYLGKKAMQEGWAVCVDQNNIDLMAQLKKLDDLKPMPVHDEINLSETIGDWLNVI